MDVNLLEKLREREKSIENSINDLQRKRDEIDERISDQEDILRSIHSEAQNIVFGGKE